MAQGITVRDVSIYDCARSGINVSEGTWGGHLIEGCDVFDTVLETHDHGSFNSWGRDRFWHLKGVARQSPNFPAGCRETSIIRNSRWRCDHGWDVDLDDGSSNYDIYNNLLLAKGLKLREGFRRHAWNNVIVNNGLHPHVWYVGNGDEVYWQYFDVSTPSRTYETTECRWRPRLTRTCFSLPMSPQVKATSDKLGWDKNSIFGDPQFVRPGQRRFSASRKARPPLISDSKISRWISSG